MSFGAPAALLGLLVLPLLAAWYVAESRARRRAAGAFAAPAMVASVAPRRPGWRRHVPLTIIAIALAALVVAAARPQRTVAVAVERASIMLATDTSGSMEATDVRPSRLAAVKRAAVDFTARVPAKVNIGVMSFGGRPVVLQSPTRDRQAIKDAVARLEPKGGTAAGDAIITALRALRGTPDADGKRPPGAILLISDGATTQGIDPVAAAQQARRAKIPIYTVALGTAQGTITVPRANGSGSETRRVPPDPESLRQIARASGGAAFSAVDAEGLSSVYEKLGSQLGRKHEQRQLTSTFAGGALALLVLGSGLSLRLFGRLI